MTTERKYRKGEAMEEKKKEPDLIEIRNKIDKIDTELTDLIVQRMNLSAEVAGYKRRTGLPVADRKREEQILEKREAQAGTETGRFVREIYEKIFEESRNYQEELLTEQK